MKFDEYEEKLKQYEEYLRSDENKLYCKPYVRECERLAEIAMQYKDNCQQLYDELSSDVVRYEYAVRGETLYRGYYCPSPVQDIVIGNCKRGKLLKKLTILSKPTYKYGFDSHNELVIVDILPVEVSFGEKEIIIRQGDTETGIRFSPHHGIVELCECRYQDGKISSYILCVYNPYDDHVSEFMKEEYRYSSEGLATADFYDFLNDEQAPILVHDQYRFQHDSEGFLSKYTSVDFDGDSVKDSVWKDHEFTVYIKRKV